MTQERKQHNKTLNTERGKEKMKTNTTPAYPIVTELAEPSVPTGTGRAVAERPLPWPAVLHPRFSCVTFSLPHGRPAGCDFWPTARTSLPRRDRNSQLCYGRSTAPGSEKRAGGGGSLTPACVPPAPSCAGTLPEERSTPMRCAVCRRGRDLRKENVNTVSPFPQTDR